MRILPVVMALAVAAIAQTATAQAPSSRDPAAISGGRYTADPDHTLVVWTLDHLGFTPYTGMFGDVTGSLTFDPKQPEATQVEVTIPVAKVTTASIGLTQHLLRPGKDGGKDGSKPDFFGRTPPNMGGKQNIGFRATGTIRRSEFGLGFGIPFVGDEVKLEIAAAFQK